jgi:hypothetical protein
MFKKIRILCKKPYGLLELKQFIYPFVFGMAAFVFVFLWIFEPFGLENLADTDKYQVISIYTGSALLLSVVQFILIQPLLFRQFRICNTFLWLILHLFLIGISNALINSYLWNDGQLSFYYILYFQGVVLSIGILPIALFIAIHYGYIMKKRLKKAMAINQQINPVKNRQTKQERLTLAALDKKQVLVCLSDLVFVKAADNYTELHILKGQKIEKTLLRSTLTNIEKQVLPHGNFIRCHKSYLVNKNYVTKVSGNAAGYKLHLLNLEYSIPVSRTLNAKIEQLFQ